MKALVELFRLVESGLTPRVWTYTNADSPIVYGGETYVPTVISRTQAESKNDMARSNLTLTMDLFNEDARNWMENTDQLLVLTVVEIDESDDVSVVWKGRFVSRKPSPTNIQMVFESVFTSIRRPGLRARFQRACRHSLYGNSCKVNRNLFVVNGVPSSMSGVSLVVPEAASYPNGYFTTGMVESSDGEFRFIINHVGNTLTLMHPWTGLEESLTLDGYGLSYGKYYGGVGVKLYPGCDRSRSTCNSRFSNLPNYGGFDWIPQRNPYDGSSIV